MFTHEEEQRVDMERKREIGLLRSLGWGRWRVLLLILGESLTLALMGGIIGVGLGVGAVFGISRSSSILGIFGSQFTPLLFVRAFVTVTVLGLVGGAYPAWWASRLLPVEALHYHGGGRSRSTRPLPGGMPVRNLLRQRTRTGFTLLGIGVSIAAIVAPLGHLRFAVLVAHVLELRTHGRQSFRIGALPAELCPARGLCLRIRSLPARLCLASGLRFR